MKKTTVITLLAAGVLTNALAPRYVAPAHLIPPLNLVARPAPPAAASRDLIRLPWATQAASSAPTSPSSPAPTTEVSPSAPAVIPPAAARNAGPGATSQGEEGGQAPGSVTLPPDWHRLAVCESGDRPHNKENPLYRGWFQIGFTEWATYHGVGHDPADATPAEQFAVALRLYAARGWQPWSSSSKCTRLR